MRRGKSGSGEKGQASILIGMIVLTFMLFFAFVVNTGMLVNAKINLQNAADLAAYAGAAVQARQLNTAAYLNYEMRRQYKKFVFRYYVIGSFMYTTFPDQPGKASKSPRVWTPKIGSNTDFGVPVVCLNFYSGTGPAAEGNYCQMDQLPKITIPPPNSLDPINSALRDQLIKLEEIRKNSCQTIADTNIQLLTLWLFNTDPNGLDPNTIDYSSAKPEYQARMRSAYARMKGVTYGLGLVPKEILLLQRLGTLQAYLNSPSRSGLNIQLVNTMRSGSDPAQVERPINAFMSAFETLGPSTFPEESIMLDELLPPGAQGARVVELKSILQDFDTWALTYKLKPGSSGNNPGDDCVPRAYPISLKRIPLGVYKDPTTLTYYALRLRAKARLLFSPFGDIELKAYSAAMPFGGRIGPGDAKILEYWTRTAAPPAPLQYTFGVASGQGIFFQPVGKVPNLPILEGENSQTGSGWDSNFAQYHFYSTLIPTNGSRQLAIEELSRATQASMAPNPWEAGRYTIINDLGDDPFVRNFDKYKSRMLWAPLVPTSQSSQVVDIVRKEVDQLFTTPGGTAIDSNRVGLFDLAAFKGSLLNTLSQYITKMKSGQGEGDAYSSLNPPPADAPHEGLNVVMLTDPFSERPPASTLGPIQIDSQVMLTDPAKIRDAWNQVNDGDFRKAGRVGYSVKFVSFDALQRKKFTTDGITSFTNTVAGDTDAQDDIAAIKH